MRRMSIEGGRRHDVILLFGRSMVKEAGPGAARPWNGTWETGTREGFADDRPMDSAPDVRSCRFGDIVAGTKALEPERLAFARSGRSSA